MKRFFVVFIIAFVILIGFFQYSRNSNNEINYILAEYKTEKSSYSIIIFIKKKLDNLKISRLIINKE